jgi:hypothetical protein
MRSTILFFQFLFVCCAAYAQSLPQAHESSANVVNSQLDLALQSSIYVKVQLDNTVKVSSLKTGDVIAGELAQDTYSGDVELFPAGSRVRLTVDKLAHRRCVPNDHWPWVVKAFTPRHENYPTFQSATVVLSDGKEVHLRASLISISRETEVRARAKTKKRTKTEQSSDRNTDAASQEASAREATDVATSKRAKRNLGAIVTLEAENPAGATSASATASGAMLSELSSPDEPASVTLTAGTPAKIVLLGGVSASSSQPGDSFQARLVEPVRLNSKVVLPEGTLLGGKVVSRTPPRMLSRAGSLLLVFNNLTLPEGKELPIAASVTAADLDRRSHTKIDPEGRLHGDRPGKAWMAINIGVTSGIAKEADDSIQLIIEAIVSTATDASTAGVGKIVATCASGLFLITRHGRDVILPRFTEMNIALDRPLSLTVTRPKSSSPGD